ncbi:MAG: rhodanese-like domain-containing protein [Myxococcales bacterium]|nr:rhodanese-like domain-containing protein [Myxococcales bacterium]
MTSFQWILLLVTAALLLFMLRRRFGDVSAVEARTLVEGGALLLDVRTPAEFASGHLPGAVSIPLAELEGRVAELGPKDRPVVTYCASGVRSAVASRLLAGAGFGKVKNLGAMSRW